MNISIDKNLRELRSKRGNTQEDLAEFLGLSPQAISRWERGETMPDITFLPQIAAYYDVSVDELLGIDVIATQKWCQEVLDKYNAVRECVGEDGLPDVAHGIENGIEILRDALVKRPNCWYLVQLLASDLWWIATHDDNICKDSALSEAEILCLQILRDCKEDRFRHCAREILCRVYKDMGQTAQALEIANGMPDATGTNDFVRMFILDGAELEKQSVASINMFVRALYKMTKHVEEVGVDLSALSNNKEFCTQLQGILRVVGYDSQSSPQIAK